MNKQDEKKSVDTEIVNEFSASDITSGICHDKIIDDDNQPDQLVDNDNLTDEIAGYNQPDELVDNTSDIVLHNLGEGISNTNLDMGKSCIINKFRQVKSKITGKDTNHLGYFKNVLIPVILYSVIVGIVTGLLVGAYNKFASLLSHWSVGIYTLVRANPAYVPLLLFVVVILALLAHALLTHTPDGRGSGVPKTVGVLRGLLTFRWLRVLLTTLSSSILSYFGGLSLGSGGPSIQIGATSAQGISELLKCRMAWSSYIMSAGAGTGLAVAFNAPLTGIIFIVEEVHRRTTPMIMISASCSIITGTIVSRLLASLWGGAEFMFGFDSGTASFAMSNIWMLVILGIAIGLLAVGFNWIIMHSEKKINKLLKIPEWAKLVFAFLVCASVGLAWPVTLGGGHELIISVGAREFAWDALLSLFVIKLGLIMFSFNSGATGGLFTPILSLGALVGALFGELFLLAGLDPELYNIIVIISMSALFGACVKTPITAIILVLEVTGDLHSFMYTGFTVIIAYTIAELFKSPALYDALLENNLLAEYKDKKHELIVFDVTIASKSFTDKKTIRDILWPPRCTVESISRQNSIIIPASDTLLFEGDILTIKVDTYEPDKTQKHLEKLLNE